MKNKRKIWVQTQRDKAEIVKTIEGYKLYDDDVTEQMSRALRARLREITYRNENAWKQK